MELWLHVNVGHWCAAQVPRRVKVVNPESQFFSVRRVAAPGKDDGSKVASGMEVVYAITFSPQSKDDYACDLVVCTEREKFIVPVVAWGAAAALDFPDAVDFGDAAPTKLECHQTVLVRNVGTKAAGFSLRTHEPFSVSPSDGFLGPGETLQVHLTFTPPTAGRFSGELELQYLDSGRLAYSTLGGAAMDVDVGLSHDTVTLLPTYVTKMSQKTFKVVNNTAQPVAFAVKAHASADEEMAAVAARIGVLHGDHEAALTASMQLGESGGSPPPAVHGEDSEDEETILANRTASLTRQVKAAQRTARLEKHLFSDKNFVVEPAEGVVLPGSQMEVVVQFMPDYAREYEVVAYVDVQGRSDRLPLLLHGKGLVGAVLGFG